MDGNCSTHGERKQIHYSRQIRREGTDRGLGLNGRTVLKWILSKYAKRVLFSCGPETHTH